jgi:hypothetical protein
MFENDLSTKEYVFVHLRLDHDKILVFLSSQSLPQSFIAFLLA